MSPKRIQRKRTKGWRMPEGAVYVGRPSRWGNPFYAGTGANSRLWAVSRYRTRMLDLTTTTDAQGSVAVDLSPIRGKDLACWCEPSSPCHADVLLELANR